MHRPVSHLGHMQACPFHGGGPIILPGQSIVTFNKIPWAVAGGKALCTPVPTTTGLLPGSSIVRINGKPVIRMGDPTDHKGKVVQGIPTIRAD